MTEAIEEDQHSIWVMTDGETIKYTHTFATGHETFKLPTYMCMNEFHSLPR